MAYVSQAEKKELAGNIKAVLKKYGVKGSIAVRNYSTLVVTLKSGKLDILSNWFNKATEHSSTNHYGDKITKPESLQINEYWIDENYTGEVCDFLNELVDAMKGENWFDKSDYQTDYFHIKHYVTINCGKWDAPYVVTV